MMLAGIAASAVAQVLRDSEPVTATWSVTPYVGAARHSPAGLNWGTTPDRDHLFVGVNLATPVLRFGRVQLMYAPNVTPFVMVTNNPRYRWTTSGGIDRKVVSGKGPVFGAGLAPFGLQLEAKASRALDIYSMAALGGAWFNDYMPMDGAKKFNFTIEFGGGLVVRATKHTGVTIGYKFEHMSNMYTARENPGVDGHVIYAGVRWQKRLRRE